MLAEQRSPDSHEHAHLMITLSCDRVDRADLASFHLKSMFICTVILHLSTCLGDTGDEAGTRSVPSNWQRLRRSPCVLQGIFKPQAGSVHAAPQKSRATRTGVRTRIGSGRRQARRETPGAFAAPEKGTGSVCGGDSAAAGAQEQIRRCLGVQKMNACFFLDTMLVLNMFRDRVAAGGWGRRGGGGVFSLLM